MFIMILVVQFIVVGKGAERVSEVAARFTLDAMPGKQMAIDADLRSGLITQDQARHMRNELAKESQLHGAMDGAMKFVKGDSIATIVIALVNISAGLSPES
jgi:type III secretion protein V